jgi:hypothetical protein
MKLFLSVIFILLHDFKPNMEGIEPMMNAV